MPKLHFFTKYTELGASSRYRTFQFLEFYNKVYFISVNSFFDNNYINSVYNNTKVGYISYLGYYLKRVTYILLKVKRNDLLFIEYELFPYFPPIFEYFFNLLGIKFILDYDDAIFHNYDLNRNYFIRFFFKNKIKSIIKKANVVITGSPYLTNFAKDYNNNVFEIPTSINYSIYSKRTKKENNQFTIGWIGTKFTSKNLKLISNALIEFSEKEDVSIKLIGFEDAELFQNCSKIQKLKWNKETEIQSLCSLDLGIMPLFDLPFENGKCGFKLIQYMACGIPTVSTPLIANCKIDHNNGNLFANSDSEWLKCFEDVYHNREKYRTIGLKNKQTAYEFYSVEKNKDLYLNIFENVWN